MLPYIRSDLSQLTAYTPHPGGTTGQPVPTPLDRLDTNECPYDLPPELKEKLAGIYQHQIETNRYPDGSHAELKAKIADYLNHTPTNTTETTPITPQNLCIGNGSDELIRSLLIATCLNQEGAIVVADPTFSMYAILAQTLGIPVISIPRHPTTFALDLTAAQTALTQSSTPPIRIIFVVHPNSPTANPLSDPEIQWLRTLPPDILVVIDEAYFEFSQTTLIPQLPQHPNWVILRTFSKAFRLAALRVGYAIGHPDLITVLEKVRLPYNLPSFSLAAACLALDYRQLLLAVIPEIIDQRHHLITHLSSIPTLKVWPSAANFLYLRLNSADNQQALPQLMADLKTQGTLVRHTGGGLRITIGSPAENQRTLKHLRNLCR